MAVLYRNPIPGASDFNYSDVYCCVNFLNSLLYLYMPYIRLRCVKNRIIKFVIAYFQMQNLAVVVVLAAIVKSKAPQLSKARNYKLSIANFSHYFQK